MKDHGAAVEYAATGRQALDYLQLGKCSLVILDVNMPLVDGFTVLEKIREANSMVQPWAQKTISSKAMSLGPMTIF